ncbi:MAG: GTPase domain-containing protein [Bacteroidales bacterium]|nr:GTPase domain-containing protein [Bacteroidales bacterium]
MEPLDHRTKTQQLADDLSWLEDHCRRQPELAEQAVHLRLAAGLARNVLGPALEDQPPQPLHVAVVGGAGTGKSTVVNFLAGAVVAEANPQAGYTRHPTAYLPADTAIPWPSTLGFLGPLRRLTQEQPGNLDEDVYQTRRLAPTTPPSPLADFVIWDCPDMTTWAAEHYVSRLLEVVSLADMIVYVASDERYNDAVPTEFFRLLIRAGKAVVVCLTKARESDAGTLVEHFRQEVLGRIPTTDATTIPPIPVVTLPHLSMSVRNDPAGEGAKYRVPLLNQLLVLSPSAAVARARTVRNALHYLEAAGDSLLHVARRDLAELETWRELVARGRTQFEERYQNTFLAVETFQRFDRTREQVLAMLELPGPGKAVSNALHLARTPWRFAREFVVKTLIRPELPHQSETQVCAESLQGWLDSLQAEALRRSGNHPIWMTIIRNFDATLKPQARARFEEAFRRLQMKETDELDQAARAVPEYLTQNPSVLNALRGVVLAADLVAVVLMIGLNWPPGWELLLLLPLGVSISHQIVESVVNRIVGVSRTRVKDHRLDLLQENLTAPLADWLTTQPTTEGSSMEKLKRVLTRVPLAIRSLQESVAAKAPHTPASENPV